MRQDLLDEDGENLAVRMFLMHYGCCNSPTVGSMREHLRLAGFDGCWPEWVGNAEGGFFEGHLTKGGAQDWLRYLFVLESQK